MIAFLLNLLLAVLWASVIGSFTAPDLVVGFLVGFLALRLLRMAGSERYVAKVPQAVSFAAYFLWELVLSNVQVAWEVLTPGVRRRPGIIAVPLSTRTDAETTLLATVVTLTPGTLSLDVSDDKTTLFVHALFAEDPDEVRARIRDGFERRVLELLR